jgi:hypothetical protein
MKRRRLIAYKRWLFERVTEVDTLPRDFRVNRLLVKAGIKLVDLVVPSVTAEAISAMPNGCSPSCYCQYCTKYGDYSCACVNLACHLDQCLNECEPNGGVCGEPP